jgi:hypothetical protein
MRPKIALVLVFTATAIIVVLAATILGNLVLPAFKLGPDPQESPHFGVQMVPNISVKTVCCCSREKKRAMSGRSLCSGIVGMSS